MTRIAAAIAVVSLFLLIPLAQANPVTLYDWGFNVNGTLYTPPGGCIYCSPDPGQLPANFNVSAFAWSNGLGTPGGLGTITAVFGPGNVNFAVFLDHEFGDFAYDEYGNFAGTPGAGQSWEIDEPGWGVYDIDGNLIYQGDIFANFSADPPALDNNNGITITRPLDVSMAMAWAFVVPSNYNGVVTLRVSTSQPASGFYLSQTDPGTADTIYLAGEASLRPVNVEGVPEPATVVLCGLGLAAALVRRRLRRA